MALKKAFGKWYRFSHGDKCPICNKQTGCMINEEGDTVVCIRIESERPFSEKFQSYLHSLDSKKEIKKIDTTKNKIHKKKSSYILDAFYRAYLSVLTLSKEHVVHLMGRGFSAEELKVRQYKTLPEKGEVAVKALQMKTGIKSFAGIPGFFKNGKGEWSVKGRNGFLVPYRNEYLQITGFQYRLDKPIGKMRYQWLSTSNDLEGAAIGDGSLPVHIALPYKELAAIEEENKNSNSIKAINKEAVWITEGALKGDLIANGLETVMIDEYKEFLGTTVISVSGVNSWSLVLPIIEKMGVKRVSLAIDMDVMENEHVARSCNQLVAALKEKNLEVYMAVWDIKDGKGLDDLFQNNCIPTIGKC